MLGTFQERSVIFLVISWLYLLRLKSDSAWTERTKILFMQMTIAIPLNQDCVSLLWHQRKSQIQEKSRVNNQCLTHKMNKQSKRNPNIYPTESEKKTTDTLQAQLWKQWVILAFEEGYMILKPTDLCLWVFSLQQRAFCQICIYQDLEMNCCYREASLKLYNIQCRKVIVKEI
jgi:hypothetical protein